MRDSHCCVMRDATYMLYLLYKKTNGNILQTHFHFAKKLAFIVIIVIIVISVLHEAEIKLN